MVKKEGNLPDMSKFKYKSTFGCFSFNHSNYTATAGNVRIALIRLDKTFTFILELL